MVDDRKLVAAVISDTKLKTPYDKMLKVAELAKEDQKKLDETLFCASRAYRIAFGNIMKKISDTVKGDPSLKDQS